jgi:hypothetical protein
MFVISELEDALYYCIRHRHHCIPYVGVLLIFKVGNLYSWLYLGP